ncbi:putative epidermal cell surface receptor isoform X2 [Chrysoperla carnea]|uniref:putative epidermal cell surface receptor isoform X2 n=1 Tax=Chrysoperla carnea TaxID=189513 RepID=UPI001D085DF8|nr:putative epidermal cell surface receptor isoform X2 [Chrysoperla carnea]
MLWSFKCLFYVSVFILLRIAEANEECTNNENCKVSTKINDLSQGINYVTLPPKKSLHALNMMTEESHHDVMDSKNISMDMQSLTTQEPKSRAINFSLNPGTSNIITTNSTNFQSPLLKQHSADPTIYVTTPKLSTKDISDVSMDDEDTDDINVDDNAAQFLFRTDKPKIYEPLFGGKKSLLMNETTTTNNDTTTVPSIIYCMHNGNKMKIGEKFDEGCDETCVCEESGIVKCVPKICDAPYFRKGRHNDDNQCFERSIENDSCCVLVVCTNEGQEDVQNTCIYKNKTYQVEEEFVDECQNCTCQQNGKVLCKPRCEAIVNNQPDKCVVITDPQDKCCPILRCDVSLNEKDSMPPEYSTLYKILSAQAINSTVIKVNIELLSENYSIITIQISDDEKNWKPIELTSTYLVTNLKPNTKYFIRTSENSTVYKVTTMPDIKNSPTQQATNDKKVISNKCEYKENKYSIGEEFHDNCTSFCICTAKGVICDKINCPTRFGLDVLDPHCLEWETIPPNFVPTPPKCCAERVRCKNNGSCLYEGIRYNNFAEIPTNLTGCHRRCYCELGKIECQDACPPVTAQPPASLPCPPHHAILTHLQDDDCCLYWMCAAVPNAPNFAPAIQNGIPHQPYPPFGQNPGQMQDDVNILELKAIDAYTVRLILTVPAILVGLHGRVELRYTSLMDNNNPTTWDTQIFAPPNDLIATPQLEFELPGLKPDTEYQIKINIFLRDLHNTLSSKVYKVRTLQTITNPYLMTPSIIPIQPDLKIIEINDTWITLSWRKFTEFELQYIDGVQIRYKTIESKIYAATPLIHRTIGSYTLSELKPNTEYEIELLFIPFEGQQTELKSEVILHATTLPKIDVFNFNVTIEANQIKSRSVEITWSGIPYPQEKYVNIYRAIYESDKDKENYSKFKLAKRDAITKTIITDLKPNTNYQLILELYLSNGKVKTSNVLNFKTREDIVSQQEIQKGKLSVSKEALADGDYYESLIIVAIVAAIAILSTLILSSILMKRHTQNKAAISSPTATMRVSQASYDNPTYKIESQQETMNL